MFFQVRPILVSINYLLSPLKFPLYPKNILKWSCKNSEKVFPELLCQTRLKNNSVLDRKSTLEFFQSFSKHFQDFFNAFQYFWRLWRLSRLSRQKVRKITSNFFMMNLVKTCWNFSRQILPKHVELRHAKSCQKCRS